VVEPGQARLYAGDRYWQASEVATQSPHGGTLEERVGSVEDLLDPVATVELVALDAEDRSDPGAVATAYSGAYDRLLEVARSDD